uniref:rhamnogalacturonan endolyase n=1 Tax=Kalanchoe fedtschenkoi TaxID=63787 RepID=A0A7N0UQB2_KALFE
MSQPELKLVIQDHQVAVDNGICQVTLSKPEGDVTAVSYNGLDNLLEVLNQDFDRGYWDLVWSVPGFAGTTGMDDRIQGTSFKVVVETDEQIELSFARNWDPSLEGKSVPLNIDKRFVMLRGASGFYCYAIYEHLKEWPGFNLPQTRIVFKLRKDKFQYMAVADNRQRRMPLPDDRVPPRGRALDYPESVLLVDPIEPEFKGEVDDKYQYSCDNKDLQVHGWIDEVSSTGFWQITPSSEFRSGGPPKQNLTSHVGPITLAMFLSAHYSGEDLVAKFGEEEPWKKVFGPVFFYINSSGNDEGRSSLWEDAKNQARVEADQWPYDFPASEDFPKANLRGKVRGRFFVQDRYASEDLIVAAGGYIGLAPPGEVGSWQRNCKGYQFWTRTDETGHFSISNVRIGDYGLNAWVPGFIGDYMNDTILAITPGCDINLGDLVYAPLRHGPTLWEIGVPDRSAAEFFVPDPDPKYINKLYVDHPHKFRQYGLWERYAELHPDGDLVYKIGESDYTKDWFFAQVPRMDMKVPHGKSSSHSTRLARTRHISCASRWPPQTWLSYK